MYLDLLADGSWYRWLDWRFDGLEQPRKTKDDLTHLSSVKVQKIELRRNNKLSTQSYVVFSLHREVFKTFMPLEKYREKS